MVKTLKFPGAGGESQAVLQETLAHLMDLIGGPTGLANLIHADLKECVAGSANRVKIEMTILDLLREFGGEGELPESEEALEALERQLRSANGDES